MNSQSPNLVARYKTLVILWAALLMSQFMLLFVVFVTKDELFRFDFSQPIYGPSGAMVLGFAVAAVTCFIFSFAFKKRFFQRAEEEQKPDHIQTGTIIACALCEASTLFGLALAFAFTYQYFFAWFVLGIVGILLHFPRQTDLLVSGYKGTKPESGM
jgi:NADH:ubiquinone oxidoreductase subunit 5 (subunit L)/multisubunit Na+/H+ antiporter MnhA subunit